MMDSWSDVGSGWSDIASVGQRSEDQTSTEGEGHEEHLRLASVVKGVHADLRNKYKKKTTDLERIWIEHCQNKPMLSQYADAMHHLATDHWSKNNQETRIDWCREVICEYFHRDGLKTVLQKEERRKEHQLAAQENKTGDGATNSNVETDGAKQEDIAPSELSSKSGKYNTVSLPVEGKISLLDVGSCYNPFLAFPEFNAVGIDISPATETVFHCDFLHLRTTDHLQVATDTMSTFVSNLRDPVDWLPRECFHVVVFSLLLEYFPAPYQRWLSCEKAHELLMYNGILVIVTPDSHKQHRNAPMMKSWKVAIESIGFRRWRYVKLEHLHCMVFRKVEISETEKQQRFVKGITADMIYIPQDISHVEDTDGYGCGGIGQFEGLENEGEFVNEALSNLPLVSSEDSEEEEEKENGRFGD